MRTVHKGMRIDEQDWKAFLGHLNGALDHFGLAGEDREAVVSFVESTQVDIVEGTAEGLPLSTLDHGLCVHVLCVYERDAVDRG